MSRAPWNNWFAWQPICSRNRPFRNGIVAAEHRKMHYPLETETLDENGNYLIGGGEVCNFIKKADKLIYG